MISMQKLMFGLLYLFFAIHCSNNGDVTIPTLNIQGSFVVSDHGFQDLIPKNNIYLNSQFMFDQHNDRYAYTITHLQRRIQQQQKQKLAALTKEQIVREISALTNLCNQKNINTEAVQRFLLEHHHLYDNPVFVACIKDFPEYRHHIKTVYRKLQEEQNSWSFAIKHRFSAVPRQFYVLWNAIYALHQEINTAELEEFEQELQSVRNYLDTFSEKNYSNPQHSTKLFAIRQEAFHEVHHNSKSIHDQKYHVQDNVKKTLIDHSINDYLFSHCNGTVLQQTLHQELIELIEQTANLAPKLQQQNVVPVKSILSLAETACEFNQLGKIAKAYAVADLCWALLDYGVAIIEGTSCGIYDAATDLIAHPLQTGVSILSSKGILAYQIAKALYCAADLGLTYLENPQEGTRQWSECLQPITQLISAIQNKEISLKDIARNVTRTAVGIRTQAKFLGTMNALFTKTKQCALNFAQKFPKSSPDQYMVLSEGKLFKAICNYKPPHNADPNNSIKWTSHGFKHFAPKNLAWKEIIELSKNGDARYKPVIDVEKLERLAWEKGIATTNGKTWKVMKFEQIIGASSGEETSYIRVELSANTIHGHPITKSEYKRLLK